MKMKKLVFVFSLAFLFFFQARPSAAWEVWTTSPWLALLTRFIGGVFVTVRPIEIWNDEGVVVRRVQTRNIPQGSRIIALDVEEASRLGLQQDDWAELAVLYKMAPFDKNRSDFYFCDPSALPFIAQRVFTALSRFDPGNYPYYQRRLSEFQTRLDSTVLVGRRLLDGSSFIDLSDSFSAMLTAAGARLLPVEDALRTAWERGEEMERLSGLLEDALGRRVPVLFDISFAPKMHDSSRNSREVVFLRKPDLDQDLLLFFHDQYIFLWNRLTGLRQEREIRN